mmetsp:Transcript_18973/g.34190  ORF Transcript_18973/g.34190 Transcript_18973/m.34190 type:complete len:1170 (+) Transcript_18973:5063-8572(+)
MHLCERFLLPISQTTQLLHSWHEGLLFIEATYRHDPPDFRSTWRRFLSKRNRIAMRELMAAIVHCIVLSSTGFDPEIPHSITHSPAPFWWLLIHLECLILAPSARPSRDGVSINQTIAHRIASIRGGAIADTYAEAMGVSSWKAPTDRPEREDNRAAQEAADNDNFRAAHARVCNNNPIASIGAHNESILHSLYAPPLRPLGHPPPPPRHTHQPVHLPGDVCATIKRASKCTGAGVNADSIDAFIDLANLNIASVNDDLRRLFNLVFQGLLPPSIAIYFTDAYLFLLHKDPNDPSKLRPIAIPSGMRRITASHIMTSYRQRFAIDMLPLNYAIGVDGGMDFIIKTVQLGIEKHISLPQSRNETPTRAAVFLDLKNMFNNISREELMNVIAEDYPELLAVANLLYHDPGVIHYRWEDGSWRNTRMEEGVNQGCPLSSLFATLVLLRVLRPLNRLMQDRASERLLRNDPGDDGHGSITHMFGYLDDVTTLVPLHDLLFFCESFNEIGAPLGCFLNPEKTRILTSTNGKSILQDLAGHDEELAEEVLMALTAFSVKAPMTPEGDATFVELQSGYRLLGAPVGSAQFAMEFFDQQLLAVETNAAALTARVPNLQTRLRLFAQCTIQKVPHLLGAEVMHLLPMDYNAHHWEEWNGPLTARVDGQIASFLGDLTGRAIPQATLMISQISVADGGLGLLNASARAIPDFVLTMAMAMRHASQGFRVNKDLAPRRLHPTVQNLYCRASNPDSLILQRFEHLLLPIADVACGPKCPADERANHLLTKTSTHSARGRLRSHCSKGLVDALYALLGDSTHVHHLPSILSPHMASPIIAMSRSNPSHRLRNNLFSYALLRKLRLPLWDPAAPPTCWCGKRHDPWGDHTFSCVANRKSGAHNAIVQGTATALQRPLATAGYILPHSKVDTERLGMMPSNGNIRPCDWCFDLDQTTSNEMTATCPYNTLGGDVTCIKPIEHTTLVDSANVKEIVTAAAVKHLQTHERLKLMRNGTTDAATDDKIRGDVLIGELIRKRIILLPMPIDPHGRWGPMFDQFLFGTRPPDQLGFRANRPNAAAMHELATQHPCPLGIIPTACIKWKRNKTSKFYGHSHTAPTPKQYIQQQLGLTITKAYAQLLRNAELRIGYRDRPRTPSRRPPGFTTHIETPPTIPTFASVEYTPI